MPEVMIVDDETDVRDAIRRVLERAGYAVRSADNGAQALDALESRGADLVITDIIMPVMDGVEAIQAIRARHPRTRIVAISGGGNFGVAEYQPEAITTTAYLAAAGQAGADALLTKPFDSAEILGAVRRALGRDSERGL
ncbi:MAG: response regulator [Gammaproteobacteria bacterium]|nr:response regulator [Gammaproteobacteria bacterium]